ncbi:MAG: hypothetical protein PWQ56_227 [Patescibacteria group bacterium]|nr:hypothetical protein [Patescibacteria group bacterium]
MKSNNIFLGFFIIVFAILFLAGKINFSLLFPVFIIFLGLSIMPQGKKITRISLVVFMIFCLSLIMIDLFKEAETEVKFLPIEIYEEIEKPNIFLSVESGSILISGSESEKLIQGNSKTNFSKSEVYTKDNNVFLSFFGSSFREDNINQIEVLINKEKDINLNLDSFLSAVKIKELSPEKINTSSFLSDVNLEINKGTEIESNSFLSSIRLVIPHNVGIRVENNLVSSSTDFANLLQVDENIFQTQDYEEMEEKINLKIDGLFSSLTIIQK